MERRQDAHTSRDQGVSLSKLGYRPALDGLRAVAIVAVLLFHTKGILPGGYLGVDLFFVLSGFLITTLLLEEHADRGFISVRDFYRRRALRLLPALFVMLAVFLAVSVIVAVANGDSFRKEIFGVLAGLGYFSNIAMTAEPAARPIPEALRHLWSLAAEEQFYLVLPAILIVLLRVRLRSALILVAGAVALTLARQLDLYLDGASRERLEFGIDTRSTSILVGCLLALVIAHRGLPRLAQSRWLELVAVGCVLALFLFHLDRALFLGPLLLFSICGALLVVRALDEQSPVSRILSLGAPVFVGRISYGLYLWHFPVFVAFDVNHRSSPATWPVVLVALALSVACAVASYYLVELPFLRRKRRAYRERETNTPRELPAPSFAGTTI